MENLKAADVANKIQFCSYTDTIDKIKSNTNWLERSCAVVCDDKNNIFGVISEADILEAEKKLENLNAIHGWELCSHNIISVDPDTDIKSVIALMLEKHIHHVLVIGKTKNCNDETNGIISTLDILRYLDNKTTVH